MLIYGYLGEKNYFEDGKKYKILTRYVPSSIFFFSVFIFLCKELNIYTGYSLCVDVDLPLSKQSV